MKHFNKKIPEKKRRDDIEILRAENRSLRKQLQQLRRQLQRMDYREEEIKEFIEEFETQIKDTEVKEVKRTCPNCKSFDVKILEKLRGDIDYYLCNNCGSKGQIK